MASRPFSDIAMTRSYALTRGPRVRFRLAQSRDRRAIFELLTRAGVDAPAFEAGRLVSADPRHSLVICATGLLSSTETLLGVGEIGLAHDQTFAPRLLIVDDELTAGLSELLTGALVGRAAALSRTRAA